MTIKMYTNTEQYKEHNHVEHNNEHAKLDDQDITEKVNSSFKEKVFTVYKNLTIELFIFLVMTGSTLHIMASQNLNLEKACRVNLNFSTEICDSLMQQDGVAHSDYERETQQLLASTFVWRIFLTATLICIVALFVGSFADKTGYMKFFLIYATTGYLLGGINSIIHVYFFYETTLEIVVLTGAIIDGLTGGYCILFMICFAYISAITTDKDRTFRVGILALCAGLASPVGWALGGILLNELGYYGVNGIFISLNIVGILYIILAIIDPKKSPEQQKYNDANWCKLLRTFFNILNLKDTLNIIIRKAPKSRRLRLCILLLMVVVIYGSVAGEQSIMYLFVRYRFQWNEVQFSLFQTINVSTNLIGTALAILIFVKYLGWHDSLLGIMSIVTKIAALFVYCFAETELLFYLGPIFDTINGISMVAVRSMMSKMVEAHEIGKLSSLIGIVENLSPLIYVPLYAKVYSETMDVLPGAVFLVGGLLMVPALAVLCYFFYEHRMQVGQSKSKESHI